MNYWRDSDYDYFVHLSGQTYPLKSLRFIKQELTSGTAYMHYFKLPATNYWIDEHGGLDRINYYYYMFDYDKFRKRIRIPRMSKTLPYGLEPYGGSHYFFLPKRVVEYVLDYSSTHPQVIKFFRHTKTPCEMFFQTIIMNSPLQSEVVDDHHSYWRWEKGGYSSVMRKQDFRELVESGKWFAKKFDMTIDRDILDLLDLEIDKDSMDPTIRK